MPVLLALIGMSLVGYAMCAIPGALWGLRRPENRLRSGVEVLLAMTPLVLWWCLVLIDNGNKSMSNIVGEPMILGLVVSAAYVPRWALSKRVPQSTLAVVVWILGVTAAIAVWRFVELMPE